MPQPKSSAFTGHYSVMLMPKLQREEMVIIIAFPELSQIYYLVFFLSSLYLCSCCCCFQKRAVSTSHCSQPNTVEYEMAMDWILSQEKSVRWWDRLFKVVTFEIFVA